MNLRTLKNALSEYSSSLDAEVRAQIEIYGPILLKTAEIANSIGDDEVSVREPSPQELSEAKKGGRHVLALGIMQINHSAFLNRAREIAGEFMNSEFYSEEFKEKMKTVDFSAFITEDGISSAQSAPMMFIEKISADLADSDPLLLSYFVFPVLKMTLRAFLDKAAQEVSRRIEASDDPVVDHERSMTCPFCGGIPNFAAVIPTASNGSSKRLYCSVCGGFWKFERIRCAACGDEAVSDLKYVHEDGDEKHRLHVCAQCSTAFPTLFSTGDATTFNPDVEAIVLSGLYSAYEAEQMKTEN